MSWKCWFCHDYVRVKEINVHGFVTEVLQEHVSDADIQRISLWVLQHVLGIYSYSYTEKNFRQVDEGNQKHNLGKRTMAIKVCSRCSDTLDERDLVMKHLSKMRTACEVADANEKSGKFRI